MPHGRAGIRSIARQYGVAALLTFSALTVVALAGGAALLVDDMHRRSVEDVERSLVGLSTVLADQADRALQAMEMVQDAVIQDFREANVASPDAYAALAEGRILHEGLKARIAALPQVNAITIIDRTGKLLNFSRYWPIPDVNIADRDYFKALSTDPNLQRFIGQPVQNRGDGAWTIYLARKVSAPDGTFLGLVLAAVELGYFEQLYKRISPTDDSVVSMFRDDGVLLARHPHRAGAIGRSFATSGALLIAAKSPAGGVLRNVSPIDHLERLVATRTLARYPIILSISRTVEASLAPFRQQAMIVAAAVVLLIACIAAMILLFFRQARGEQKLARANTARAAAEARERGERDLRTQYTRFGIALDNMIQGLCLFDVDGRLVVMNERFAALYAVPAHLQRPGVDAEDIHRTVLATQVVAAEASNRLVWDAEAHGAASGTTIIRLVDGRDISVVRALIPGGGWVCTHEDVTERRRSEERMRFLARHDALTTLPNRVQFEEVVGRELAVSAKTGSEVALLCIDLDGFKPVNDLFGHPVGDRLLIEVAARLRSLLGERCFAARLGGDEFAVLVTGLDGYKTPAGAAQSIIDALSAPYEDSQRRIDIGCSVGIAAFPRDGQSYAQLLSAADMALVRAKHEDKGSYRFFEPRMDAIARERHQLAQDMRAAIGTAQFQLHYQPQFDVAANRACGFEALLRWTHPTRGPISPAQFVPLAEETGLILPLGEWVLREACREAASWTRPLGIAVNLSIAQFRQANLCDVVRTVLRETGLRPDRLDLEVTESLFLESSARSQDLLTELKLLGVRIAIDDFGTGYSSLATLQAFPFDKIKIDRSFVGQIGMTSKGSAIVRAIIGLGESLDVPVIAEGIETEEQLTFLRLHRCAEVQGYLRGRPQPITEYHSLLDAVADEPVARLRCA